MIELPRGRISHSMEDAYKGEWGCPKKFWYQNIEKVPAPTSAAMLRGTVVDIALTYAADLQLRGKPRPTPEKVADHAATLWPMKLAQAKSDSGMDVEFNFKKGETSEKMQAGARLAAETFERERGHLVRPKLIQQDLRIQFADRDYAITLRLDILESDGWITDYKVTGRKKPELEAVLSSQLTKYQVGTEQKTGEQIAGLRLAVLVVSSDGKKCGLQILEAPRRTDEQVERCLAETDETVDAIKAGIFTRVNDPKRCRSCQYLKACRPDWYDIFNTDAGDGSDN